MTTEPGQAPKRPFFKRRGAPLLITGVILIIVFGLFILADMEPGQNAFTPMWIGVLFGAGIAGYGLYRALKGPGMLDDPRGGTTNEPM